VPTATPSGSVLREMGSTEMMLELIVRTAIGHLGTGTGVLKGSETVLLKFWFETISITRVPVGGRGALPGLTRSRWSGSERLWLSITTTEREATTKSAMITAALTSLEGARRLDKSS
jgi:hypothetical protein